MKIPFLYFIGFLILLLSIIVFFIYNILSLIWEFKFKSWTNYTSEEGFFDRKGDKNIYYTYLRYINNIKNLDDG